MRRLALASMAILGLVWSSPAFACGGLFCSNAPVDQAGEQILFIQDFDTVQAHVQITYQGDAKDFSWVVPVPTQPTLGVGSDALFLALRAATRPQFSAVRTTSGTCDDTGVAYPATATTGTVTSVAVLSQTQVGPYDTAVIQANDPGALKKWLTDNHYVLPAKLDPLLNPYVAGKYYFVALKLTKDASVGDIQPIVLKYKAPKPGIPIRLTSVAATPNMAVYAWVLGEQRAVPENYRHAVINEARIDWLQGGTNYNQLVTEAMKEAGGQAFVTDYAGPSKAVALDAFQTARFDLAALGAASDPLVFMRLLREEGFLQQALSGAPFTNQLAFLKRHLPKPTSLADVQDFLFYDDIDRYADQLRAAGTRVDSEKAVQDLKATFIGPNDEIRVQFAKHPYLTQLFTTLSPEDMTQDPTFRFNPDLPEVSNVHTAAAVTECSGRYTTGNAPVRITLEDGTLYHLRFGPAPGASAIALPAARRIEQLSASGPPAVITDNGATIAAVLASAKDDALAFDPANGALVQTSRAPATGFGCMGCSATNTAPPPLREGLGEGATYALVGMGFWGYRRSKRRR